MKWPALCGPFLYGMNDPTHFEDETMPDIFPPSGSSRYSFGTKARIISAAQVLDPQAKSVVMTSAGNITIKTPDGTSIPFVGLAAGAVIPFVVAEVVSIGGGGAAATIDG